MAKKYEYHKRNDYPGERVDEKKRVAKREEEAEKKADERVAEKGRTDRLNADARVARKGRRDQKSMDSEKRRRDAEATRIKRQRDYGNKITMVIIAGLIVALVAGSVWGLMNMQRQSEEIDKLNSALDEAQNSQLSANRETCEETDSTKLLYTSLLDSVSPSNNEKNVSVNSQITVMFSQDMDPSTINEDTFMVKQRTTPESGSDAGQYRSLPIDGIITYSDRKATFAPEDKLNPNQIYGNVFTVTITDEVEDTEGNSLQNDYTWSFTTGNNPFITGDTTS